MMFSLTLVIVAVLCAISYSQDCAVNSYDKVDCGFSGITQSSCEAKSCCWAEVNGSPWCFYGAGVAPSSCYGFQPDASVPFSSSEVSTMRSYFMKNINIENKGGIVAAPDTETPGGSYYFHWMRDGALTMRALQETAASFASVEDTVKSYVKWVLHVQSEAGTVVDLIITCKRSNIFHLNGNRSQWPRRENRAEIYVTKWRSLY